MGGGVVDGQCDWLADSEPNLKPAAGKLQTNLPHAQKAHELAAAFAFGSSKHGEGHKTGIWWKLSEMKLDP